MECGQLTSVRAIIDSGSAYLELRGPDGESCGRLPIAEHSGRWYIDPWSNPLR